MDWFLAFAALALVASVLCSIAYPRTDDADADPDDDDDDAYDFEEDEDYEEAAELAGRIEELAEGAAWSKVRARLDALLDVSLPELLELREDARLDQCELEDLPGTLADEPDDGQSQAVRQRLQRADLLETNVDARIAATKTALERVLAIVEQRAAGDPSESVRLLDEAKRENDLTLRSANGADEPADRDDE